MNNKKRFLTIIFITSIFAYGISYFLTDIVSKKIQKSVLTMEYLSYNIQYLKDLHTLCMLDYTINPNGKDILKDCKIIEEQIVTTINHVEKNEGFYNFYEKYVK